MRKSLLLVVAMIVSFASTITAQTTFEAPDTVCVNQPIQLKTKRPDAKSHYWGFCSGYMFDTAKGKNLGSAFQLDGPTDMVIEQDDDGKYYGFVLNAGSGSSDQSFLRLEYGESLDNTPTVVNFGTMHDILPKEPTSMYIVRDPEDKRWYIFLTAGLSASTSTIARIDFGTSLGNTPNIVDFGNLQNKLNAPTGVFVAKNSADDKWYGFALNRLSTELIRFDMDSNISLTPKVVDITLNGGGFKSPRDLAAVLDNGKWYFYVADTTTDSMFSRIDMGTLTNIAPTVKNYSNDDLGLPEFMQPVGLSIVRDCGSLHAIVICRRESDVLRIDMPADLVNGTYEGINFSNVGKVLGPSSITRIIRDRDNVYAYITNQSDASLTQMNFLQCNNTDITYSLSKNPPKYKYTTPGYYNVYYATNEGMPDMQVECTQIYASPIPPLIMTADTTICQGDTAYLEIISINAISYTWTPNYNTSNTSKNSLKVWPEFTSTYNVKMPFPIGTCIVDTSITVNVVKVDADAGPTRTITDGATTMLGGPQTSQTKNYLRRWSPNQYIDDIYSDNPIVRPPHDFTYYLTVIDTGNSPACAVIDTVIVYVECDDINLPNVFTPEAGGNRSTFGIANSQLVKLERFNIYDRWGKQVFTTTDPTKEWDGQINGEKAAVAVYVYEVVGYCESGKLFRKTGNVTLLR